MSPVSMKRDIFIPVLQNKKGQKYVISDTVQHKIVPCSMYILLLNFSAYTDEYNIQDFIFWRKIRKGTFLFLLSVVKRDKVMSHKNMYKHKIVPE